MILYPSYLKRPARPAGLKNKDMNSVEAALFLGDSHLGNPVHLLKDGDEKAKGIFIRTIDAESEDDLFISLDGKSVSVPCEGLFLKDATFGDLRITSHSGKKIDLIGVENKDLFTFAQTVNCNIGDYRESSKVFVYLPENNYAVLADWVFSNPDIRYTHFGDLDAAALETYERFFWNDPRRSEDKVSFAVPVPDDLEFLFKNFGVEMQQGAALKAIRESRSKGTEDRRTAALKDCILKHSAQKRIVCVEQQIFCKLDENGRAYCPKGKEVKVETFESFGLKEKYKPIPERLGGTASTNVMRIYGDMKIDLQNDKEEMRNIMNDMENISKRMTSELPSPEEMIRGENPLETLRKGYVELSQLILQAKALDRKIRMQEESLMDFESNIMLAYSMIMERDTIQA